MSWPLHNWSKWTPVEHFWDTSWGSKAPSTWMIRRCSSCGKVKAKAVYGVFIPLDDEVEVRR